LVFELKTLFELFLHVLVFLKMLAAPKTIRKKPANSCKNPQTPANPEISLFWVFFWYMDAVLRSCAKDTYLYKKVNHFVRCLTYLLGTTRPSAAEGRGTQKHLVVCIWPVTATQPTAYDNGIYNIFAQQEMSQEFQGNLVELFFSRKLLRTSCSRLQPPYFSIQGTTALHWK
jgi:hypothetical protein